MENSIQFWASIISTMLITGATIYYIWLTYRLLRIQNSAQVIARLVNHEQAAQWIKLSIENIGKSNAYNVEFKTDLSNRTYIYNKEENEHDLTFEKFTALKNGIRCLTPGDKIEYLVANYPCVPDNVKPYEIVITYKDSTRWRKCKENFYLDLKTMENSDNFSLFRNIAKIPDIVKSLDGIERTLRARN